MIEKNFAGGMLRISLDGGTLGELSASRQGIDAAFEAGEMVTADWEPEHGVLVDLEGTDSQSRGPAAAGMEQDA